MSTPSSASPEHPSPERLSADGGPAKRHGSPLIGQGNNVTIVFGAAVLIVVVGAALVGLIDKWWVLIPVFLCVFLCTFMVIMMIGRLLNAEDDGYDEDSPSNGH